ncbi:UNVERIFIED_CONTAM: hypothetical protein NCL1_57606 [Trichonephila clavipes]
MEASWLICTMEERRTVALFLVVEGVKPSEIIRCMQVHYIDSSLCGSKIYEWVECFKQGRNSLCEDERLGSLSTSSTGSRRCSGDGRDGLYPAQVPHLPQTKSELLPSFPL